VKLFPEDSSAVVFKREDKAQAYDEETLALVIPYTGMKQTDLLPLFPSAPECWTVPPRIPYSLNIET